MVTTYIVLTSSKLFRESFTHVVAMQLQKFCSRNDYLSVHNGYAACMHVSKDKKTLAYLPAGVKLHLSA